jgi:hypothetical protein
MQEQEEHKDWSAWFSTYGLLTADRLLDRFGVHLGQDDMVKVVKDPDSIYYLLLQVPLKNVFNGIILQQAHDYKIYAQKLLVDYLLSGEETKPDEANGALARDDLERERLKLIDMGDAFELQVKAHKLLIANSQKILVEFSKNLASSDRDQLQAIVDEYLVQIAELNINLRNFRSWFYASILDINGMLKILPDYKIDEAKIAENLEPLVFDASIGESSGIGV